MRQRNCHLQILPQFPQPKQQSVGVSPLEKGSQRLWLPTGCWLYSVDSILAPCNYRVRSFTLQKYTKIMARLLWLPWSLAIHYELSIGESGPKMDRGCRRTEIVSYSKLYPKYFIFQNRRERWLFYVCLKDDEFWNEFTIWNELCPASPRVQFWSALPYCYVRWLPQILGVFIWNHPRWATTLQNAELLWARARFSLCLVSKKERNAHGIIANWI